MCSISDKQFMEHMYLRSIELVGSKTFQLFVQNIGNLPSYAAADQRLAIPGFNTSAFV